jgi:hypothetical protein
MIHIKALALGLFYVGGFLGFITLFCTSLDFYPKTTISSTGIVCGVIFSYCFGRAILEARAPSISVSKTHQDPLD